MGKINSKKKGNNGELQLVHILEKRFGKGKFKRTPSSGAFTGGKNREGSENLSYEAKVVLASDIIVPMEFKFIIEHKFYNNISFWELFSDKSNWNQWVKQASDDAEFVNKEPLIIAKYNHHKRIVLIRNGFFMAALRKFQPQINYREFIWNGYAVLPLEDLLKLPDEFWFIKEE